MKIKSILIGICTFLFVAQSSMANADLVVVVNPHTTFNSLTRDELRRIFLGQTSNFPNGDHAIPFDVYGDYRNAFYQFILVRTPESVENYWANMIFTGKAEPPRQVQLDEAKQLVATSFGGISYIERSQVDSSVKVINIVIKK